MSIPDRIMFYIDSQFGLSNLVFFLIICAGAVILFLWSGKRSDKERAGQDKVEKIMFLLFIITSVLIIIAELIYGFARGSLFIIINLVFWAAANILYRFLKNGKALRVRTALIALLVIYAVFGVLYIVSRPGFTYLQAVLNVKASESISEEHELITTSKYRRFFTGKTDSGMLSTDYYTMVFDGYNEILYWSDPYTGAYGSVNLAENSFPVPSLN